MRRKRLPSAESCDLESIQPNPKQSKLEDFFSVLNNPSLPALAQCPGNVLDDSLVSHSSPTRQSPLKTDLCSASKSTVPQDLAALLLEQSILTTETVKKIFSHLELLASLLKERLPAAPKGSLGDFCSESRPNSTDFTASCSHVSKGGSSRPSPIQAEPVETKLILVPNSAAVTVFPHYGNIPDWSSLRLAKLHLSILLKVALYDIDLTRVERLPSSPWQSRLLLHFRSPSIPRLMFSRNRVLEEKGIFAQRHFKNIAITRLWAMQRKGRGEETRYPLHERQVSSQLPLRSQCTLSSSHQLSTLPVVLNDRAETSMDSSVLPLVQLETASTSPISMTLPKASSLSPNFCVWDLPVEKIIKTLQDCTSPLTLSTRHSLIPTDPLEGAVGRSTCGVTPLMEDQVNPATCHLLDLASPAICVSDEILEPSILPLHDCLMPPLPMVADPNISIVSTGDDSASFNVGVSEDSALHQTPGNSSP